MVMVVVMPGMDGRMVMMVMVVVMTGAAPTSHDHDDEDGNDHVYIYVINEYTLSGKYYIKYSISIP